MGGLCENSKINAKKSPKYLFQWIANLAWYVYIQKKLFGKIEIENKLKKYFGVLLIKTIFILFTAFQTNHCIFQIEI